VGVLYKNRTIFTRGFGYSDKNIRRVPDPETTYCLGSRTKAFTAVALVLLAQQGRIQWKAPVSDYLPAFDTPYNPSFGHNATVADILSHSTGLAPLLYGILGKNDSILNRYEDVVHISSRLPCYALLRSKWQYNNWFYALAACLVDKESKGTWSDCVYEITHSLDLTRTNFYPPVDDNVARAYIVFSDGSSIERALPTLQGGDAFDRFNQVMRERYARMV
jgi:CubicO group peptidase (beta-lactamase class C family)